MQLSKLKIWLSENRGRIIVLGFLLPFVIGWLYIAGLYTFYNAANISVELTKSVRSGPDADKNKQIIVEIKDIPLECKQALIAAEDRNFYFHVGIDLNGFVRGVISEAFGNSSGSSSISQQVVKIANQNYFNRGLFTKISETIYALKLDNTYTKDQILEMYFNYAYYGNYNYGIGAASYDYFFKSVDELNVNECAYLAGLPNRPSIFNPYVDPESGNDRRREILKTMFQLGVIDAKTFSDIYEVSPQFYIEKP